MMIGFLDSNVLVYAFDDDRHRTPIARELLAAGHLIGLQCLNEFANVARRKLSFSWLEVNAALSAIKVLVASVLPLDLDVHCNGLAVAERYGLTVYDGQLVAVALAAKCDSFYSEDMHHGLVVDGRLTIINPFHA